MARILLYHHLGLGDHIMCHGIVREYCKKCEHVTIFSYPHNYPSVAFMFRDLENLTIIKGDIESARALIAKNSSAGDAAYDEIKIIGFENLDRSSGTQLEKQFYDLAGVPLAKKWKSFYVRRDHGKEKALFDAAAPLGDYAFVHEDASRKYIIKRKYIGKNCRVFLPDVPSAETIFDYLTVIEKAKEIHVIDSSFMFLIDCLDYTNPEQKLYVHRYARENNEWQLPILKKDWYIVTTESSWLDPVQKTLESLYASKNFLFNNTFFRRVVRRIFRDMGWVMGRPKRPPLTGLIQRYTPERSFAAIDAPEQLSIAQAAGATGVTALSTKHVDTSAPSDVVFYSGAVTGDADSKKLLRALRALTKQLVILNTSSVLKKSLGRNDELTPPEIELLLREAGFSVREKHIFPSETCFVCRAV